MGREEKGEERRKRRGGEATKIQKRIMMLESEVRVGPRRVGWGA
jgi:hypothetical protein